MHLRKIHLVNFKNIPEAEIAFAVKANCFLGNNGAGKTNLLDAIYYLSFCKGFVNPADTQNIRHEEGFFVVQGEYDVKGETHHLYCGLKKGQKKVFKRNKAEYERLADHIGFVPLVMISPSDHILITGGSEERRKFMDGIISQYDKKYLDNLLQYNRILAQRNSLLKHLRAEGRKDEATLSVYDSQLDALADVAYKARKSFLEKYIPIFRNFYQMISRGSEEVSLEYQSHLHEGGLEPQLRQHRQRDFALQYTTRGIHKDDLDFGIAGHPLKKFGSQGQQKSFVIALRLAQFDFLKEVKERKPILLLDDIFDKLDDARVSSLMKLVSEDHFGQIFVTDANEHRVPHLFADSKVEMKKFRVDNGRVEELK